MILGLVCARKGSVGLPDKNIRELKGVKLIERAILKAWDAGCDHVVVSTDYPSFECDWRDATWYPRPHNLCGPDVSKWDVWRDAASRCRGGDIVVDIDVTRPLCTAETVRKVIQYATPWHSMSPHDAALAVAESNKNPAFDLLDVTPGYGATPCMPCVGVVRQQFPTTYQHAGCYAFTRDALFSRTGIFDGPITPVIVDRIQSYDIDDELDWRIVEALA